MCAAHTPTLCTARLRHPSTLHFLFSPDCPSPDASTPRSCEAAPFSKPGIWLSPRLLFKNAASFEDEKKPLLPPWAVRVSGTGRLVANRMGRERGRARRNSKDGQSYTPHHVARVPENKIGGYIYAFSEKIRLTRVTSHFLASRICSSSPGRQKVTMLWMP